VVLIVENDLPFAKLLLETAREKGFKGLVTSLGAAALAMTREYNPAAVTLDICLPDIDGWRVLERLKNDLQTRHMPVCVISTEEATTRGLGLGVFSIIAKPIKTKETLEKLFDDMKEFVGRPTRELLIACQDSAQRQRFHEFLDGGGVHITTVTDGGEALKYLRQRPIDCLVLETGLPDLSLASFADELKREPGLQDCPVVVYADRDLSPADEAGLKDLAQRVPLRQVHSADRLLDQAVFGLHFPVDKLSPPQREVLQELHQTDKILTGKKVLIVDDDIRNIFALTSILEWHNMVIVSAETGLLLQKFVATWVRNLLVAV